MHSVPRKTASQWRWCKANLRREQRREPRRQGLVIGWETMGKTKLGETPSHCAIAVEGQLAVVERE